MRVTSKDIAKKLNISQSTVSLVVSGKSEGRVSNSMREKILKTADKLGYRPNSAARTLRLGKSNAIAFVVPDVMNPFFAHVLKGAKFVATKNNYAVILLDIMSVEGWEKWLINSIVEKSFDGSIIYAANPIPPELIKAFGSNVVLIETSSDIASTVQLNIKQMTKKAINYLIKLGHHRIAYLGAEYEKETFFLRHEAFIEALEEANISIDKGQIKKSKFDIDIALIAAKALLSDSPPPTAVFCDDDLLAAAVYKAARFFKKQIPDDLSVIGFNNLQISQILEPALTTVAIPAEEIGKQAMQLILEQINGMQPTSSQINLSLIIRESASEPKSPNE